MRPQCLLSVLFLFISVVGHCTTHYVKVGGNGNGTSWQNASGDLQAIIDIALEWDVIKIAEGTYYPTQCITCSTTDRAKSFFINKKISLVGGYPNAGNTSENDGTAYPTILSGDIGLALDNSDNSFHVLHIDFTTEEYYNLLHIEGITFKDGNANGDDVLDKNGAGVYITKGNCDFANCSFYNHTAVGDGGAIYIAYHLDDNEDEDEQENKSNYFTYCNFDNNQSNNGAGIFSNSYDKSRVINCRFSNNTATEKGGAICNEVSSHIRLFGSLFFDNSAENGGAVFLSKPLTQDDEDYFCRTKVIHCTFANNTASSGSCLAIANFTQPIVFLRSILLSNAYPGISVDTVHSSSPKIIMADNLTDLAAIDDLGCCNYITASNTTFNSTNPFVNSANDDYNIGIFSSATNRGYSVSNSSCYDDDDDGGDDCAPDQVDETYFDESNEDLAGNDRSNNYPDIGAYEFFLSYPNLPVLYVNPNATGLNNGFTWDDAVTNLEDAFYIARNYKVDAIWIAEGTYQPVGCSNSNCTGATNYSFDLTFQDSDTITLYGGFPATGNPEFEDRDWMAHPTIFSGEIGQPDNMDDNIKTLMQRYYRSGNVVLNGFSFIRASSYAINANEIMLENCLFSENLVGLRCKTIGDDCEAFVVAKNCVFNDHFGGQAIYGDSDAYLTLESCLIEHNKLGLYMGSGSYLTVDQCTFRFNNNDGSYGGAIYSEGRSIVINSSSFIQNNASGSGGALYASSPNTFRITNSLFAENSGSKGGVISVQQKAGDSDQFVNCTFYKNMATSGGDLFEVRSSAFTSEALVFRNSILWDHEFPFSTDTLPANYPIVFDHCLSNYDNCGAINNTSDCTPRNFFVNSSPFVDAANFDFQLNDSTQAINHGDAALLTNYQQYDLLGNNRLEAANIDIGALEYFGLNATYYDLDNDGFYSDADCNDFSTSINPNAQEIPYNGIDDDCNSLSFDNDLDQDGFLFENDCDDNNALVNSTSFEYPYNGLDDDCNAATLDDDYDQDGFPLAADCNDNNPTISSGAGEIPYNSLDDDCNPATPDDDIDNDGFLLAVDCDDNNAFVNSSAVEIPYNGSDDDCNTATPDDDLDGDDFNTAFDCNDYDPLVNMDATEIPYNGIDDDCNTASPDNDIDGDGFLLADDCDDNNAFVNSSAVEIPYNGIDDDCNTASPDDDIDGDGFLLADDCDDNNVFVSLNATEIPNNGIDEDCNGSDLINTSTDDRQIIAPHIFPNPTSGIVQVVFPKLVEGSYQIRDYTGKLMMESVIRTTTTLNISDLPSGVYLLFINTEEGIWTERLVKVQAE